MSNLAQSLGQVMAVGDDRARVNIAVDSLRAGHVALAVTA